MGEANGFLPFPKSFATKVIHYAQEPEQWEALAVVTPISTSTNYKQLAPAVFKKYGYSRRQNPSREVLENVLAKLDKCKYGLCFSSGTGALTAVINLLSTGDHIICGDDVYGGTNQLLHDVEKLGIKTTFVEVRDLKQLEQAIQPNTKLLWVESPTNPTMKVTDIKSVAKICKKYNIIFAIDNSILTSYLQRPIGLGADLVMYSLTKYINGHSDVAMGAVTTNNEEVYNRLKHIQCCEFCQMEGFSINSRHTEFASWPALQPRVWAHTLLEAVAMGIVPAPFDCYQVTRGLKTLPLRMEQHSKNSTIIATFLESHPMVLKVLHPGIPSHPNYELTKKQTSGHSGLFVFYIKGALEQAKQFLNALKIVTLAGSFGGFESLTEISLLTSHACISDEQKKALNITDNMIRISIGLEDAEDLVADIKQALDSVKL